MRKVYTNEEREELIRAVQVRGESVAAAAERLGIVEATAYNWLRAERAKPSTASRGRPESPRFAKLVRASNEDAAVVVRVGVAAIEIRAGFDEELLRAVVAALGGDAA